jgi:hypothetical protein
MVSVLTIGVAAALPELSTVLDATRRRTPNVALGVLVGSNLVNPLVGLGLGAAISGYHVPDPVVLWTSPSNSWSPSRCWRISAWDRTARSPAGRGATSSSPTSST